MSNGDYADDYDYPVRLGRGGGYPDGGEACRLAVDLYLWPTGKHKSVGFRLALRSGKKIPIPDEKSHE